MEALNHLQITGLLILITFFSQFTDYMVLTAIMPHVVARQVQLNKTRVAVYILDC